MNLTEVSIGGLWTAAAINVLGYIWHAFSATYNTFPDPASTVGHPDIPAILPPRKRTLPPGAPPHRVPVPVPHRVPPPVLRPHAVPPGLHAPPQGVHPGAPPINVPGAPGAPHPTGPQPGSPWRGIPGFDPGLPGQGPGIKLPGGIRIPLPDIIPEI